MEINRLCMIVAVSICVIPASLAQTATREDVGALKGSTHFVAVKDGATWGLRIEQAGMASAIQPHPVEFEFFQAPDAITRIFAGYDHVQLSLHGLSATAHVHGPGEVQFDVTDSWAIEGDCVRLARVVKVSGSSDQGFATAVTFVHTQPHPRSQVNYFAPGMIYGGVEHLSPAAIGGSATYGPGSHGDVQVREDRLPAPMFGVWFPDGSALTVLDPTPNGATTKADAHDVQAQTLMDERFQFGALGVHLDGDRHEQGFWFPGTEGEVTYHGNTYPGGQMHGWRRRYHPVRDGLTQNYQIIFRVSSGESFTDYMRNGWRWAYQTLKPPITWQNLPALRRSLTDVLASQVEVSGGRAGIPNFVSATPDEVHAPDRQACMGFTGKQLESAEMLLADSGWDNDKVRAAHDRQLGLQMFSSFLRLRMNPPIGECFDIVTGEPGLAIPRDHRMYLRSFSDDFKATVRAYRRERIAGHPHPEWLSWAKQFADWLLTQQQAEGGFPRAWHPGSGEVVDASPLSSYNSVPFLVLLSEETHDKRYLRAAKRAAEFTWAHGQSSGSFVGGTIDNPDILDKEAGTLSMEAYIALYQATRDPKWLERAKVAADYAETYIYIWNIPMAVDEDDPSLNWKKGVPTYGTQLIATGHSLVDEFMAFNVPEYAELSRWTGDRHYLAIATLLLHDTKNMTAVPGRTFDLNGPGWQQEHWSFAPVRGYGLNRSWLPWVSTSQLQGMQGLEEFDPELYKNLSTPGALGTGK